MAASGQSKFGLFRNNLKNAWRTDRRHFLRSVTAWLLFSAIIVVFVFWGLQPQHAGVAAGGSAANVNGDIVSIAEFSEQVEMMSREPRFEQLQQFGGDFARQMIRQQALQSLVDQRLLGESLNRLGLYTPDGQIRDSILEIDAFKENGRFSHTRYLGYLQASRQDAGQFEGKIRRQLSVNRVAKVFSAALKPLPLETERLQAIEGKKRNVEAVTIATEQLVAPAAIQPAEIKEFKQKADSAARIKAYFETHKTEFSQPEQAKVRHILLRAERSDSAAADKAKAKADELVASLNKGGDFAALAKANSQDPGSKEKGGLIDYFARGSMVPEFESYAFSAKIGEVSPPIQSNFGFHIIRVEDRRAASEQKLEDVQDSIASILVAQERTRTEVDALEKTLAAGDPSAVQAFLVRNKLSWVETGNFAVTAEALPKVGGGDEAVSTALKLSKEKPLAPKLVRMGPQALLLRYKELAPEKVADKGSKPGDKKEENQELMAETKAARRTEDAFGQWVADLRKSAKIAVNPEIAGGAGKQNQ